MCNVLFAFCFSEDFAEWKGEKKVAASVCVTVLRTMCHYIHEWFP